MKSVYRLDSPASDWEAALPIGNGRLGASVWGDPYHETLTINEETVWCGGPQQRKNRNAASHVDVIRQKLLNGQVEDAQFLCQMAMSGTPKYIRPYQKACDARFIFANCHEEITDYSRSLDLDHALTSVSFQAGSTCYTRELFVSLKYQVIAMRLKADGPDRMKFQFNLNRRPFEECNGGDGNRTIWLRGQCGNGVQYYNAAMLGSTDGTFVQLGDYLAVSDASEAVFYFNCETDFAGNDPEKVCLGRLETASAAGWETLYRTHLEDYGKLYNTMSLQLETEDFSSISMDKLLKRTHEEAVRRYLTQMMVAFGRYLLICSSTQCQLPPTLQGIWCGSYTPSWESKYTININLELNYWPVNSCGLEPCITPFAQFMKRLCENGKSTAREIYGCRGSVAHHNTDCWANADIEGLPASAYMWPMGEAWLSLQLYEYYAYTLDKAFLREYALPVLRENVLFFYDYLYRSENGEWLSGPSVSPENTYITADGQIASITMAPTMDNQILRELCTDYIAGCKALDEEDEVRKMAAEILEHLPADKIGSDGRICEWREDYEEVERGHRHMSHLFGLYPGHQIHADNPEFYAAAKKVIDTRLQYGGGHTGWSRVWLICMYARLHEAALTAENIRLYFEKSVIENLYDSCPPFQIDGNFGFCAGVVECLAQSYNDRIELLPAIPEEWHKGHVKGLRLRGGLTLDMEWDEQAVRCHFVSVSDHTFTVYLANNTQTLQAKAGQIIEMSFTL